MKVAYLGAGTWGFALAALLGESGHEVKVWARNKELAEKLKASRSHPKLPDSFAPPSLYFTSSLEEALEGAELIVESVTSAGIRPLFQQISALKAKSVPIIVTSKGIEQGTGLLLPEVILTVLDLNETALVGCLTGPSHAEEVIQKLPTSVVCSGYVPEMISCVQELFTTPTFRVYPNNDIRGVCFGGAMKNIFAIACGISDGLEMGDNAKAAILTRGLHEMRKLSAAKNCIPETLNGLSGLGDLSVTCMSRHSRNYRFGKLLAQGFSPEGARQKIGMAVEGIYTCVSARELGRKYQIPAPITEVTYSMIYEELDPRAAVKALLQRAIKEERL